MLSLHDILYCSLKKKGKNMKRKLMFAYGSNMLTKQAFKRMPHAKKYGTAHLIDYAFNFAGNGVASVYEKAGSKVPGVLYSITEKDFLKMDSFEGFPYVYNCYKLPIEHNSSLKEAWVYINNSRNIFVLPKEEYMYKILLGAEEAGLPDNHIWKAYTNAIDSFNI